MVNVSVWGIIKHLKKIMSQRSLIIFFKKLKLLTMKRAVSDIFPITRTHRQLTQLEIL
jgi:hypothetical protein